MNKMRFLLAGILACMVSVFMNAQVTIGSENVPVGGALLQVKSMAPVTPDSANATKGLGLPRVKLSHKSELYPMFLEYPDRAFDPATNNGKADYLNPANNEALKKLHTGLVVYNTDDSDDGLCQGFNQWDGKEWNCFQTKMGNAKFDPIDCNSITVHGAYVEGVDINANNYLSISVNVTREGAYTIAVKAKRNSPGHTGHGDANGYAFYLTGVVLEKGPMTLLVPAQGKPLIPSEEITPVTNPSTYYADDLIVEGLPMQNNVCAHKVQVEKDLATYSIQCNSITVHGEYRKTTTLNTSHFIRMNVNVSATGSYHITGTSQSGISFDAHNVFTTTGNHTVDLMGSGKPTVYDDITVQITANTPDGNAHCTATVHVIYPAMKYASIGSSNWYSWAPAENLTRRYQALRNTANFGTNGTFKFDGLSHDWTETSITAATNHLNQSPKPDIVLFFCYGFVLGTSSQNTAFVNALVNYINAGGCVMFASQDGNTNIPNAILGGIFGSAYSNVCQTQVAGSPSEDNCYPIANNPSDPIINGPFGNLSGRDWGEDNLSNQSIITYTLPPGSVQICSAMTPYGKPAVNPDYSIVWYNESKNFVYFGDSTGASSDASGVGADAHNFPCYLLNLLPTPKLYGYNAANQRFVYNSALEFNALAWMIKRAAVSGINPH